MDNRPDYPNRAVTCFPIDLGAYEVALLLKNRGPAFNVGKYNGAGGRQKIGESPVGAARREALEELGLDLPESGQWQQFHQEHRWDNDMHLYFYTASVPGLRNKIKRGLTDEEVEVFRIEDLLQEFAGFNTLRNSLEGKLGGPGSKYVYNLGYLIPMALTWLYNPQHQYR